MKKSCLFCRSKKGKDTVRKINFFLRESTFIRNIFFLWRELNNFQAILHF